MANNEVDDHVYLVIEGVAYKRLKEIFAHELVTMSDGKPTKTKCAEMAIVAYAHMLKRKKEREAKENAKG